MTCLATRFASKKRDAETGSDYFLARYYYAAEGRLTSSCTAHIPWTVS
jgi:hypothetical protein